MKVPQMQKIPDRGEIEKQILRSAQDDKFWGADA